MAAHDAVLTRPWADGEHAFRLPIKQLLELQEKCGAGPIKIFDRLQQRDWRVEDVRETIRLGLIGGGMAPHAALVLVSRYVDGCLIDNVAVAIDVLAASLMGPPGEETAGAGKQTAAEETDGSPPPPSTVSAPSSDSPPATLAT